MVAAMADKAATVADAEDQLMSILATISMSQDWPSRLARPISRRFLANSAR